MRFYNLEKVYIEELSFIYNLQMKHEKSWTFNFLIEK